MEIKITLASQEHTNDIVELWSKLMEIHTALDVTYFSKQFDSIDEYKSDIEWFIKSDSNIVFIAIVNDKIVGYSTAELVYFSNTFYNSNSICAIRDIMIEPNYQHLGIGKSFIDEIKKWAKSVNIYKIELSVFSKNKSAYAFFKNQSFEDQFHKLSINFN